MAERNRGNPSWLAAGSAAVSLAQWVVVVVIARRGDAGDLGAFSLALAVAAPIALLTQLQLREVLAADIGSEINDAVYHRLRLWGAVALVVVATVVGVVWLPAHEAAIVIIVAATRAVDGYSDIYWGRLQRVGRLREVFMSQMARSVLAVVIFAVVLSQGSLLVALAVAGLGPVMVLIGYDTRVARATRPTLRVAPTASAVRKLAVATAPLGLAAVLASIYQNLPRFQLQAIEGSAAVGLFAAASYLSYIGRLAVEALAQAYLPRFSLAATEGIHALRRLLVVPYGLAITVGLVSLGIAAVAGDSVLRVAYGSGYEGLKGSLVVLCAGVAFDLMGTVASVTLVATRQYRRRLGAVVAAFTVQFGAGLFLIPRRGVFGAAASSLVGSVVYATLTGLAIIVSDGPNRRPLPVEAAP